MCVCVSVCVCVCVCLSGWLAGWLAGWPVWSCLSVCLVRSHFASQCSEKSCETVSSWMRFSAKIAGWCFQPQTYHFSRGKNEPNAQNPQPLFLWLTVLLPSPRHRNLGFGMVWLKSWCVTLDHSGTMNSSQCAVVGCTFGGPCSQWINTRQPYLFY